MMVYYSTSLSILTPSIHFYQPKKALAMTVTIRPCQTVFGLSYVLLAGSDPDVPGIVKQYFDFSDALREAVDYLNGAEYEPIPSDDYFSIKSAARKKKGSL